MGIARGARCRPADSGVRPAYTFWPAQTPTWIDRLMGCCRSKIHDDDHSRLKFGRTSSGVPTDALVGDFEQDKERQDLNDVGQALLEHRYRHATQLNLSFNDCSHLSDVSAVGTGLAALTALQELTLFFNSCEQLSDVSEVGTALAALTLLQKLTLYFNECQQLSDVSAVGTALASLTSLQKLTLSFNFCSQLSDVSAVGTGLACLTALQELTLSFLYCEQLSDVSAVGTA